MKTASPAKTKPKARIITNPAEIRRICLNQPQYSAEFVERSVLEGIKTGHSRKNLPSK